MDDIASRPCEDEAAMVLQAVQRSNDFGATWESSTEIPLRDDVTGKAVQVCEKWLLRPYRGALIVLGWLSFSRRGRLPHVLIVTGYLAAIVTTFALQGFVCFQRDLLFLTKETCVNDLKIDENLVCCQKHFVTAFVIQDILILASYIFGLYLFSTTETENLSKLAGEVFTRTARASAGKFPKMLIATIGTYFIAGIAWIILSAIAKILYLLAFRYIGPDITIVWMNNTRNVTQDEKVGFVVASMVGFIFFDMVYTASIINYAIQSELNVYLLKAISKLAETKKYNNLDEVVKEVRNAEENLIMLNGKTATGASLIIFQLGISAIVALQQLDLLTEGGAITTQIDNKDLSYVVALLNALLWIAMVVFAFVQASRVTGAGLELKKSGVHIRSRPLQYSSSLQSDLDSFVLYTHAAKLRAKLFGVPIYPWMMNTAFAALPLILIVMAKSDLYTPLPHF